MSLQKLGVRDKPLKKGSSSLLRVVFCSYWKLGTAYNKKIIRVEA